MENKISLAKVSESTNLISNVFLFYYYQMRLFILTNMLLLTSHSPLSPLNITSHLSSLIACFFFFTNTLFLILSVHTKSVEFIAACCMSMHLYPYFFAPFTLFYQCVCLLFFTKVAVGY